MSISSVTSATTAAATTATATTAAKTASAAATTTEETASQSASANTAAVYEKSGIGDHASKVATKQGIDPAEVKKALEQSQKQSESMANLVKNMLSKQSASSVAANAMGIPTDTALGSILSRIQNGEDVTTVDSATQAQAKKDIAEGGYYSVENTGNRILDFAKAIAGDDTAKLEKMMAAVEKGFAQAEKAWGDKLPQISQDTMAYVRKGFEELLNNGTATTAVAAQ